MLLYCGAGEGQFERLRVSLVWSPCKGLNRKTNWCLFAKSKLEFQMFQSKKRSDETKQEEEQARIESEGMERLGKRKDLWGSVSLEETVYEQYSKRGLLLWDQILLEKQWQCNTVYVIDLPHQNRRLAFWDGLTVWRHWIHYIMLYIYIYISVHVWFYILYCTPTSHGMIKYVDMEKFHESL